MNISKTANSIKNATQKTINSFKKPSNSPNPMGKVIFLIIAILFIVFIIYIIYIAVQKSKEAKEKSPVIINDVIDANISRTIPKENVPSILEGMNHSFSTWIYVKDWNYKFGQYKNILWKGNPNNTSTDGNSSMIGNIHSPSIWLYPLTNSLKVVTSTSSPEQVESCDIQNIPLMAWVHITYVLHDRSVDIYINGKLERSCALRGIPKVGQDLPIHITTGSPQAGFYGKIGKTQYFVKALLPNEVANIYQEGPLGSKQYQIQFFKDGKFVNFSKSESVAGSK